MTRRFRGVDPFLEDLAFWREFHESFILYARAAIAAMLVGFLASFVPLASAEEERSSYLWKRGPSGDEGFFPIAVWLQQPRNAVRFREAGINLYVGLWQGPTEEQLDMLARAGMQVICAQNSIALENRENPVIVGWMHGDEPDNAQSLGPGKGYGPPIPPADIVSDYRRMREADPSRPVLLNLGQGVAWDDYIGRGVRRRHPEDYAEYIAGSDIVSFDIYPAVHEAPEVAGKLEFVPRGVERLLEWSGGKKIVWNCIECTRIGNPEVKPTPEQTQAEVWMSLIRGSRGIIYFVHQFAPEFREAALLDDPEMLAAVTALNREIRDLAPVLNAPTARDAVQVQVSDPAVPVAVMVKRKTRKSREPSRCWGSPAR
jgi:hypothetical protein